MPEAVIYVAGQIAIAVTDFLLAVGVPFEVALAIGQASVYVAEALIYAGLAYATAPQIPRPESGKQDFRQAVASRRRGYGDSVRIAGPDAFYESVKGKAYVVQALHHGRITGINRWYLHDDEVTLGTGLGVLPEYVDIYPDGRYGTNKIKIQHRLGLDTETAYADVVAAFPALWTTDHRGDRVASACMVSEKAKDTLQAKVHPNGLEVFSADASLSPVWDWRAGGQDLGDDTTWVVSNNIFVNLRDYLCGSPDDGCMGEDYTRRVLPSLDYWTDAAADCDDPTATTTGTEPRYEMRGFYEFTNHPADIIGEMLKCCDGNMMEAGDGSLLVRSGRYYEPEIVFDDRHITDYTIRRFQPDEDVTNELLITYCDRTLSHTMVECDPWRDEADIAAREIERSDGLELRWVQSFSQARRLAKREIWRRLAPARGTFTTNLYGLRGIGERYVRIQISEIPALNDIPVEITRLEIDLAAKKLVYTYIQANPDIDAWDPATEEGSTAGGVRPGAGAEDVPFINDQVVTFSLSGGGIYVARAQLFLDDPGRDDLRYVVQWKVSGATSWTTDPAQDGAIDADSPSRGLYVLTAIIPTDRMVDCRAAYRFGDGSLSEWSNTVTVNTNDDGTGSGGITPGGPGGGGGGGGEIP